uniref:Ubiquitin-like protease family profile domain-containing protein n=1 Tax=Chenopodium quinoa TaxID=63459 RepID=A0A803MHU3_CHEQI
MTELLYNMLYKVVIDSSAGNDASASEGCRPCKLSADVFRDNSLSGGGKMKELSKVIERCSMELKRPENVNCRVESFGATISKFDEDKRKLVKEMGFAGLSMVTIDGKEFGFSPIQVHWVLGIPMRKKSVPKKATEEMSSMLDRVRSRYSRTTPSLVEGIPRQSRQSLVEAVEGPLEDPSDFKIAFLLLAINVKAAYGRAHEMNTEDVMPLKRPAVVMEEVYQSMFNAVHSQQECVDVVDELINIRCVKKRRYGYFKKKDLASGSGDAHVQPDLNVHDYAVDSPLMSGDVMDDNELDHRNLQSPTAYELDFDLDLDRDTESQNDTDSHKRERERELYLLVELELGLEFQFAIDLYVSAAGKLYEKVWAARYADRSKRFMLDPMFAMRVFQRREMVINTRVFTPQMDGVRPKRINVVFVPVLFEGHWWCVAFSVNREEILVIDSIQTSSASEVHSANVDHLAYAMDLVFQSLDPKWEVGTVTAWRRTSLQMAQQGDLHSCGVHMLAAIKRNAERLLTDVKLDDDINLQRSWLLWEDLMSEFNEVRSDVVTLLSPQTKH